MMAAKIQIKNDPDRKDPTLLLPKEEMSYEIKKKKKKKKKTQEDPFKDLEIETKHFPDIPTLALDHEVNIKVENIESNFHELSNDADHMLDIHNEDYYPEPAITIKEEVQEGAILTFEKIINIDNKNVIDVKAETAQVHLCLVCHLVFKSDKTLEVHQKRMHQMFRKPCKHCCDYCGMSYDAKNSLAAHIKRKHGPDSSPEDVEDQICEVCALVFKGKSRLRMHMIRKHGKSEDSFTYICSECGLKYDKQRSLIVHMKRKHSNVQVLSNQRFACPFCPKAFGKRETYVRHVQRNHKLQDESIKMENLDKDLEGCRNEITGEITCKECPLIFTSMSYLKLHMRRKHNALRDSFKLKCRICNMSYDKPESLKRHVRRKHDRRLYCRVCNKDFISREAFLTHTHIKVIKECPICGQIFASERGLAKHIRCIHKKDSPKTVFCGTCNQAFRDQRHLKQHLIKDHLKVTYSCKFCHKTFKSKESLRRHLVVKHPFQKIDSVSYQKCEYCPEMFKDEFELCKHINLIHANDTKIFPKLKIETDVEEIKEEPKETYQCIKCSDSYETWNELKLHYEQNHHVVKDTQCQVCGELVPMNVLDKHIKTVHTKVDELKCNYCEFKTKSRVSLTQHMLRHKNAATLHCEFNGCRYKTFYEGAMLKHKKKHAELGVKYQCTQCPFQSMNKYILKYHEEAHETGKKRYTCNQCDFATILPANLVQHKYKHSTEKRFKCEVCPFATKYNTSLRFHVRKKHCDLPS